MGIRKGGSKVAISLLRDERDFFSDARDGRKHSKAGRVGVSAGHLSRGREDHPILRNYFTNPLAHSGWHFERQSESQRTMSATGSCFLRSAESEGQSMP